MASEGVQLDSIIRSCGLATEMEQITVKSNRGAAQVYTTGVISAMDVDLDRDGIDEYLYILLADNSNNDYGSGMSIVAQVYERVDNDLLLSDSAVLCERVGWDKDRVNVFLLRSDGVDYIFAEHLYHPNGVFTAEHTAATYDGDNVSLTYALYDPGYSSGKGLYAGADRDHCLYEM